MNYGDRETLTQARRLLLAVATDHDDARVKLLLDVGFKIDDWYAIAYFMAEDMVRLLDGIAFASGAGQPRECTIRCIESMLAQVLDE